MGGWMTYQRVRNRNGLMPRKPSDGPDLYPCDLPPEQAARYRLGGDLDRMERDYLNPVYPKPPFARRGPGSDPAAEVAAATGVDVETVRAVLDHVFRQQT